LSICTKSTDKADRSPKKPDSQAKTYKERQTERFICDKFAMALFIPYKCFDLDQTENLIRDKNAYADITL